MAQKQANPPAAVHDCMQEQEEQQHQLDASASASQSSSASQGPVQFGNVTLNGASGNTTIYLIVAAVLLAGLWIWKAKK